MPLDDSIIDSVYVDNVKITYTTVRRPVSDCVWRAATSDVLNYIQDHVIRKYFDSGLHVYFCLDGHLTKVIKLYEY